MNLKAVEPYKNVLIMFGTETQTADDVFSDSVARKFSVFKKDGKEISFKFYSLFDMWKTNQKVKEYIDKHLDELKKKTLYQK